MRSVGRMGQHISGSELGDRYTTGSSEARRRLAFRDRAGRSATGSVSDREKPTAMPKDWGMFRAELGDAWSRDKLGLEQSVRAHTRRFASNNNAITD